MSRKPILVAVAVCAAVMATANVSQYEIFEGRGAAESRGAGIAEFSGRVAQRPAGGIAGDFTFTSRTRNPERTVRIVLREAARFEVVGRQARFSGPGRLVVIIDGREHPHQGQVMVEAIDRRQPDRPGQEPDLLKVRFESPTLRGGYSFEGVVHRGNIFVGQRDR